jgi:hypothetical protein
MLVEIVDDADGEKPALIFPADEDFLSLRENPGAIENIDVARRYAPLRNFLTTVNDKDSVFITASATTHADSPAAVSAGLAYEFASQANLVFADSSYNFDRKRFTELAASLKELLERDPADATRAVLRISTCDFPAQNRRGRFTGNTLPCSRSIPNTSRWRTAWPSVSIGCKGTLDR